MGVSCLARLLLKDGADRGLELICLGLGGRRLVEGSFRVTTRSL